MHDDVAILSGFQIHMYERRLLVPVLGFDKAVTDVEFVDIGEFRVLVEERWWCRGHQRAGPNPYVM